MPVTKNALLRYQVLNDCFRNRGKYWSKKELIDKLDENDIRIAERTLKLTIEAMRHDDRLGYHAPIAWCYTNHGYYYTDPEYSINLINLNEQEQKTLAHTRDVMESYKDIEALKDAPSLLTRIIRQANSAMLQRWPRLPTLQCVVPANTDAVARNVSVLLVATCDMTVVHLRVNEAGKEEDYDLHPYRLDHDSEHWYLIGLRDDTHIHIFVQLEYIGSLRLSTRAYIPFQNPFADVRIPFTPA
jgi:predicted DNA-binding transcriptional regulator YafY